MLWNLALCGFLIWLDSKKVLRRGYLIAVYVLGYAIGRSWIELLRIDKASRLFGVRVNVWTSLLRDRRGVVVLGIGIRKGRDPSRNRRSRPNRPNPTTSTTPRPTADDAAEAERRRRGRVRGSASDGGGRVDRLRAGSTAEPTIGRTEASPPRRQTSEA